MSLNSLSVCGMLYYLRRPFIGKNVGILNCLALVSLPSSRRGLVGTNSLVAGKTADVAMLRWIAPSCFCLFTPGTFAADVA